MNVVTTMFQVALKGHEAMFVIVETRVINISIFVKGVIDDQFEFTCLFIIEFNQVKRQRNTKILYIGLLVIRWLDRRLYKAGWVKMKGMSFINVSIGRCA